MNRGIYGVGLLGLMGACAGNNPDESGSNHAPTCAAVELSSYAPTVADVLQATPTGVADSDGDEVTLSYAWTVNGADVSETGTDLDLDVYKKGDVVEVVVTPTDGEEAGAGVSSGPATIANSAPVLDDAQLSRAGANGDLRVVVEASDIDADDTLEFTYRWSKNATVQPFTGDTIQSTLLKIGDAWQVTVEVDDGTDSASLDSNLVSISNTTPAAPDTVVLSGDLAAAGDPLQCTTSAVVDPDGQDVEYEFEFLRDGTAAQGLTTDGLTATLSSRTTKMGEVWTCRVRAMDESAAQSDWTTSNEQSFVCGTTEALELAPSRSFTLAYTDGSAWVNSYLVAETVGGGAPTDDLVGLMKFETPTTGYRGIDTAELELFVASRSGSAYIDVSRVEAPWPGDEYPTKDEAVRDITLAGGLTATDLKVGTEAYVTLDPEGLNLPSGANLVIGLDNLAGAASKVEFGSSRAGGAAPVLRVSMCKLP